MKSLNKLFIVGVLTSILFSSCEVEEEGFFQASQVSPILNANVPDTMFLGDTYTLRIAYQRDSDCHTFSNFDSENRGDSLIFVRAITIFTQAPNCSQNPEIVSTEVDFTNEITSDFTFKFLKDVNSEGESLYIDKEVVVLLE